MLDASSFAASNICGDREWGDVVRGRGVQQRIRSFVSLRLSKGGTVLLGVCFLHRAWDF